MRYSRTGMLLFFGAAVIGVTALALLAARGPGGFAGSAGSAPFGWMFIVAAGLIISGVSLLLLAEGPRHLHDDERSTLTLTCRVCRRKVLGEWGHCPYCGTEITNGVDLERRSGDGAHLRSATPTDDPTREVMT